MKYEFDKTEEGWRAIVVFDDDNSRLAVGPVFPTQTEAVLYTFQLDTVPNAPADGDRRLIGRTFELTAAGENCGRRAQTVSHAGSLASRGKRSR